MPRLCARVVDIYFDRPFEIPAFDVFAVSPETLDEYVRVYSSSGAPNKWTVSRDGGTLLAQPGNQGAAARSKRRPTTSFNSSTGS